MELPSSKRWKDFYGEYKRLVKYRGSSYHYYQTIGKRMGTVTADARLSREQVKEYFRECCMENLEYDEISSWLKEMKSCIDYYKL